jgi:phage baseplate assembly protein W
MAVAKRTDILGTDLKALYRVTDGRYEDLDYLRVENVRAGRIEEDLTTVAGVDNAVQAVIHRLLTLRGELADLGHPDYGSRHHELIGQPNTENNRNLVKLYILQALALEPRIEKIRAADIVYDPTIARDRVEIDLSLTFIGAPVPLDLVIPFSFGGVL